MSSTMQSTADIGALDAASAQDRPKDHVHVPALDGVRGCAILLVFFGHLTESLTYEFNITNPLLKLGSLGWIGVDLFFVLSGFLITGILYDAKSRPNFFRNFYARRTLRIFPLYYLAIAVVILLAAAVPALSDYWGENGIWIALYLTNVLQTLEGPGSAGVLDHFWSLAVEEHFYLVWPAIVFLLDRKKLMMVAAAAIAVAFLTRFGLVWNDQHFAAYVLTPARMDSLAAGALIALAARGPAGVGALFRPALIVGPLAAAALAGLIVLRGTTDPRDSAIAVFGLSATWAICGSLLIAGLVWGPAVKTLSNGVLRWFGKYSYGLYVWHPIVVITTLHSEIGRAARGGDGPLQAVAAFAVAIVLTFAVTLLSWKLVEKPFLSLKSRFA